MKMIGDFPDANANAYDSIYGPYHSYSMTLTLSTETSDVHHHPLQCRAHLPHLLLTTTTRYRRLDVLAQPPNSLSISLPHNHTAHEDLNWPDALKRHLAFTRCLIQTQHTAQLVLGDGIGVIDLVTQDDKGRVLQLFHGEQGVQLGFGFVQPLVVFCVDEEDDAGYFGDCNC